MRYLVVLLAGCATVSIEPVRIAVERVSPSVLARALEEAGQPAERVDAGVTTRWRDTGLGYGFVGGHPANVFRRYIASITGDAVTLRVETQRCVPGSWDETASVGACELLVGLLPRDRDALREIAEKVRISFAGTEARHH
jgi:hypothetical protein